MQRPGYPLHLGVISVSLRVDEGERMPLSASATWSDLAGPLAARDAAVPLWLTTSATQPVL